MFGKLAPWLACVAALAAALLAARVLDADIDTWSDDLRSASALDRELAMIGLRMDPELPVDVVIDAAVEGILDQSEKVRGQSSKTLREAGARAPEIIARLLVDEGVSHADRSAALHASHAIGKKLLPHLLERLPEIHRREDDPVFNAYRARGRPAVDGLSAILSDSSIDADRRARAARTLAAMGGAAVSAQKILGQALPDPDERIRFWSLTAIQRTPKHPPSLTRVVYTLRDDSSERVRERATAILVRNLVEQLTNENEDIAERAQAKLREIGRDAFPGLVVALAHSNVRVAVHSGRLLLRSDEENGLRALIEAIRRANDRRRKLFMKMVVGRGERAVPVLIEALAAPNPRGRVQMTQMLGRIGPPAAPAVPALTRALNDRVPSIRLWAAYALGQIGEPALETLPLIEELLEGRDPDELPDQFEAMRKLQALRAERQ